MNDELTVLCIRHNKRRCMLASKGDYPPRLMHMSRIGTPSDFCDSEQFWVRWGYKDGRQSVVRREYVAGRDVVHAELTAAAEGSRQT